MEVTKNILWLILNATIVWFVLSFIGVYLLKSKALFGCLVVLPVLALPNFYEFDSLYLKWYLLSMLYGCLGIVAGVLVAEYQKTKTFISNIHKPSFFMLVASRFGVGISSVYIFVYLCSKVFNGFIQSVPMLKMVLDFSLPKINTRGAIFEYIHFSGVLTSIGVIVFCVISIIASLYFSKKHQTKNIKE